MNRTKLFNFVRKCNIAFRRYALNIRLAKKQRCTMRYMTHRKIFIKHQKLSHLITTESPKQLEYSEKTNENVHSNFSDSDNLIQPGFIIFKIQIFFEKYFGSRFAFFPSIKIKNLALLIDVNNLCKLKNYQQHFIMNRFAQKDFFHRVLFAFLTTKRQISPQVVADIIASEMARHKKKHMSLLYSINDMFGVLHSEHIKGYKILIDGKINGRNKTTKQIFRLYNRAKIPFQDFGNRISYALGVSRTYTGLFGIRVWLYY